MGGRILRIVSKEVSCETLSVIYTNIAYRLFLLVLLEAVRELVRCQPVYFIILLLLFPCLFTAVKKRCCFLSSGKENNNSKDSRKKTNK